MTSPVTQDQFASFETRMEKRFEVLTEAVTALVRVEERQVMLNKRIDDVEEEQRDHAKAIAATNLEVAKWVQRGFGLYAALAGVFTIAVALIGVYGKLH